MNPKLNKQYYPSINRKFGLLMAGFFLVFTLSALYRDASIFELICWISGCLTISLIALFSPSLLAPLSNTWMRLGDLMGKLINPLVLGAIFFLLVTPVGLLGQFFGRDELRLKRKQTNSYWTDRDSMESSPHSFTNQY